MYKGIEPKRKGGPEWVDPPAPVSALDNFKLYQQLTPWREASGAAAGAAAGRLGAPRSGLLSSLVMRAQQGLDLGGALGAEESRAASQVGAAAAQQRGLGGMQSVLQQVLSNASYANARRQQREGFAAQVAGMEDQNRQLDLQTLQGAQGGALSGLEFAEGVRQWDTSRGDTQVFNRNQFNMDRYTADKNAKAAKRSSTGSIIGGALGAIGSIFSA